MLSISLPGLEQGNFDVNAGDAIPNAQEVGQALIDYGALLGEMQTFLAERCGSDLSALDSRAQQIIDDIASGVLTVEPAGALTFVPIISDDGALTADVPASWVEVDGAPDGELRQLAAAPALQAFNDGFTEPGMFLLSGASAAPDSWIAALDSTVQSSQAAGCSVVETLEYDDGVYTGTEQVLNCGSAETETRVIGGRDEAGELFFLLGIIFPSDQIEIRDTIVQTFFI